MTNGKNRSTLIDNFVAQVSSGDVQKAREDWAVGKAKFDRHCLVSELSTRWAEIRAVLIGLGDRAGLDGWDLSYLDLTEFDFSGLRLPRVSFEGADLSGANLRNIYALEANLTGARLVKTELHGAQFRASTVSGKTLLLTELFDRKTDFSIVGLAALRIEPGLRSALESNIRRRSWRKWIRQAPIRRFPMRVFWGISDYGTSLGRPALVFLVLTLAFSLFYWVVEGFAPAWSLIDPPLEGVNAAPFSIECFLRTTYFSIVTMTTLGFGDIRVNPTSHLGHFAVMVHVLAGYITLGAFVARLAVLLQSLGPENLK